MSPGRSRSGGTWIGITFSRNSRSSRNRPSVTARARSLFVAATMRTSTRIGLPPPTRSISRASIARSSFACASGAEVADLVEKQRAGVRELEPSDAAVRRAGERALLVPEHLALDEIARNRRAVHAHERAVASRARAVDRRRDELLARAGFAGDQHARVGRRDARDQSAHARASPELSPIISPPSPRSCAQRARFAPRAPQLERRRKREQHALGRQRLLEKVEGAELGRAHGVAQSRAAAHHDHRARRASPPAAASSVAIPSSSPGIIRSSSTTSGSCSARARAPARRRRHRARRSLRRSAARRPCGGCSVRRR